VQLILYSSSEVIPWTHLHIVSAEVSEIELDAI
jgi:hypothetical protein